MTLPLRAGNLLKPMLGAQLAPCPSLRVTPPPLAPRPSMPAGNLLKPMLGRGELRCIGATTLDEYRQYIEKDPALERRFQQVSEVDCGVFVGWWGGGMGFGVWGGGLGVLWGPWGLWGQPGKRVLQLRPCCAWLALLPLAAVRCQHSPGLP